jgi:hypothetical protein
MVVADQEVAEEPELLDQEEMVGPGEGEGREVVVNPPAGLAPGASDIRLQHGAGVALPERPRLVAEGANLP